MIERKRMFFSLPWKPGVHCSELVTILGKPQIKVRIRNAYLKCSVVYFAALQLRYASRMRTLT